MGVREVKKEGLALKALSVRQPWACFIENGEKTVECRSWSTSYRGRLLICASAQRDRTWDMSAFGLSRDEIEEAMPVGVAVCVVDLVDVRPLVSTDREAACMAEEEMPPDGERYAWIFKNPRSVLDIIPVKGKLGFFDVDLPEDAVADEVNVPEGGAGCP